MHYEEKWVDGWIWCRHSLHGEWERASEEVMMSRMRTALEAIVEITEASDKQRSDLAWLRGALLAAGAAALGALGR